MLNLTKMGIPDGGLFKGVITRPSFRVTSSGYRGFRLMLANGFVASLRVVGPIVEDLTYLPGNLRQQRRNHLAVMHDASGNLTATISFGCSSTLR
jgi:hypothetical protein